MTRKTGYEPPEGFDPDTASENERRIVNDLQRAYEEFAAHKNPTIEERIAFIQEQLREQGYPTTLSELWDAAKSRNKEAVKVGGEAAWTVPLGPKGMAAAGVVGWAISMITGLKAEKVQSARSEIFERAMHGAGQVVGSAHRIIKDQFNPSEKSADKPDDLEP